MGTAADWHDGVQDSYSGGEGWCYVGVDSSGNIKFLGDNPPDETDTLGNSAGKLIYWNNSGTYWFVVGAVRIDTADIAAFEIHSYGRWSGTRAANHSVLSSGSATSWTSIDLSSIVPANGVHVHGHLWVSRSDSGNYEFDVGDDGFELVSMRFNPKHSGANLRGVTQFNYPIRTSQTIYYIAGAAAMNCTMFIGAWEF
jgi:hypothetical protein